MVLPEGDCHLKEFSMAEWTQSIEVVTASIMLAPWARCAVMAAERVQPVPWVQPISIFGAVKW